MHPHLVLCEVPDEKALAYEQARLEALGVRTVSFREPDRNNELTAIATEPLVGEARRPMRRYRLLAENDGEQNDEASRFPLIRGPPCCHLLPPIRT